MPGKYAPILALHTSVGTPIPYNNDPQVVNKKVRQLCDTSMWVSCRNSQNLTDQIQQPLKSTHAQSVQCFPARAKSVILRGTAGKDRACNIVNCKKLIFYLEMVQNPEEDNDSHLNAFKYPRTLFLVP